MTRQLVGAASRLGMGRRGGVVEAHGLGCSARLKPREAVRLGPRLEELGRNAEHTIWCGAAEVSL